MATINTIAQTLATKNVGLSAKQFDPKLIAGALIVPRGTVIDHTTNLANLQTFLQGLANNNTADLRLYPISNLYDFKDNSEKPVTQSFSYGPEVTVRDGIYKWAFQYVKGGKTLNDALRTFNGADWDFFFIDAKNVILGFLNEGDLQAIPSIEIYTEPFKANDGKKVAEYIIEFKFNPKYLNELGGFIADADFDILDNIYGLQDVDLAVTANVTAKVFNMTVKSKLGQDIGALYSTSSGLAQVSLWSAIVTSTGVVLTVSSVSWDATTSSFVITLGASEYPTSGTITFDLVGPTALAARGVAGFESSGSVAIVEH